MSDPKWSIEYDNDTGSGDDCFHEWWTVSNGQRSFRTSYEEQAQWLCAVLNKNQKCADGGKMRIKINKDGVLEIERAGKFKEQCCPYNTNEHCGDQCPLFHEPIGTKGEGLMSLELCRTTHTIEFSDFTDERAKAR